MISAESCLLGRALLKWVRSGIPGLSRLLLWASRASAQPAAALPETARSAPAAQPPPVAASAIAEDQAQVAAHLEYLGYEVGPDADGWRQARHPSRYHFHLRTLEWGTMLYCEVGIGASIGNSHDAWTGLVNKANERGHVTRFSLVECSGGLFNVRMRALVSGGYNRRVFARVMDLWHDDVDLVRRRPEFPEESSVRAREAEATATVN
jgi:hypothetical protein